MLNCRWPFALGFVAAVAIGSVCAVLPAAEPASDDWQAPARAARKKNPIAADENSITAGKATFVKECLSCHGAAGKGDGPAAKDLTKSPGDLTTAKFWQQSDGAIFWKITEGRKPMPGFDQLLSEDQRWHVVNYLHSFEAKDKK